MNCYCNKSFVFKWIVWNIITLNMAVQSVERLKTVRIIFTRFSKNSCTPFGEFILYDILDVRKWKSNLIRPSNVGHDFATDMIPLCTTCRRRRIPNRHRPPGYSVRLQTPVFRCQQNVTYLLTEMRVVTRFGASYHSPRATLHRWPMTERTSNAPSTL